MQRVKKMIEEFSTGIKNRFGLNGSFAGKYQMAVFNYNKK
jgi:hypothetical protein